MKIDYFLLLVLIVYNLFLGFLVVRLLRIFRRLTKGIKEGNLETLLDGVLKEEKVVKEEVSLIWKKIKDLQEESYSFFEKVGLVKFNPFSEAGGDQSFSLALLNKKDKGLVITSLHGRQTTRIYIKLVNGKETKFSQEEQLAIKKATALLKK